MPEFPVLQYPHPETDLGQSRWLLAKIGSQSTREQKKKRSSTIVTHNAGRGGVKRTKTEQNHARRRPIVGEPFIIQPTDAWQPVVSRFCGNELVVPGGSPFQPVSLFCIIFYRKLSKRASNIVLQVVHLLNRSRFIKLETGLEAIRGASFRRLSHIDLKANPQLSYS